MAPAATSAAAGSALADPQVGQHCRRAQRSSVEPRTWNDFQVRAARSSHFTSSACVGCWTNVRALVGRFSSTVLLCVAPRQAREGCTQQRAALPVPWMGPGLAAGLGGPSSTVRTAARAQVCPHSRMLVCTPAALALRMLTAACSLQFATSQVTICAPSAAIEASRVPLVRLGAYPRWDVHACLLCTVCGARVHGSRSDPCPLSTFARTFAG